jgi:NADH-quinone oxidoreductase subunit J
MRDYGDKGLHPGPLPPPGVFARHNAVDTPALLPDGTTAEASISRVLRARGTVRSAPALADDIEGVQRSLEGRTTSLRDDAVTETGPDIAPDLAPETAPETEGGRR